jgi:C4-type Zn-finger protein
MQNMQLENKVTKLEQNIIKIYEMIEILRSTNNPTYQTTIEGLIHAGNDFIEAKYNLIDQHEQLKHHANAVLMQVLKEQKQQGHT